MRLLLDTNALLWQLGMSDAGQLGKRAKELIQSADAVYVSSISLVEMHIKTMLGKLDAPEGMVRFVEESGDVVLEFTGVAADTIRGFPNLARHDPFDRMLLAQAEREGLTFVTADAVLLGLHLDYVVDARK